MTRITFEKLTRPYEKLILDWLGKPHIKEFWDNSPEHREDIHLFTQGRVKPSTYFNGIFTYWVGFYNEVPYAFIMTSQVLSSPDLPSSWKDYIPNEGTAYGLDFCIGNQDFLGKGLAHKTLEEFMFFLKKQIDPKTKRFFIDPDTKNPRAIHVYKKAGFKIVDTFQIKEGFFKDHDSILMIKDI